MTKIRDIAIVITLSVALSGCIPIQRYTPARQPRSDIQKISHAQYLPTQPISVKLLTNKKIKTPHQVIGTIHVSNYNNVGVKRQLAIINDVLQEDAAKVGGNAIIALKYNNKETTGTIIRFLSL